MNLTIFANEIVFPSLLFFFFAYIMLFYPQIEIANTKEIKPQQEAITNDPFKDFYELIIRDRNIQTELDSISDRQTLIDRLLHIATIHNYQFLASDIEREITSNTNDSQSDYICLPIGC